MARIFRLSVLLVAALSLALLPASAFAQGNGNGNGNGGDNGKGKQKTEQSQADDEGKGKQKVKQSQTDEGEDAEADEGDNKHPSGKDRQDDASYPQGHSESDPDGDENGGADKPGGDGGVDKEDQDGNNGCGNDDDFEDDNNGNCGGLKKGQQPAPPEQELSVGAACFAVTVHSSEDLDSLLVVFADGTSDDLTAEFNALDVEQHTFTFSDAGPAVSSVKAEAGELSAEKTVTEVCGQGGVQGQVESLEIEASCFLVTIESSVELTKVVVTHADDSVQTVDSNLTLGDDDTLTISFAKTLASAKVFTTEDATLATVSEVCDEDVVLDTGADLHVDESGVITAGPTGELNADEAGVLSAGAENAPAPAGEEAEAGVLGAAFDAGEEEAEAAPASALALTGLTVLGFLAAAGLLTLAGFGLRRVAQRIER